MNTPVLHTRVLGADPQALLPNGPAPAPQTTSAPLAFSSPDRAAAVADHAGFETFYRDQYESLVRSLSITLGDLALGREAADEAMLRAYSNWNKISGYEQPTGWAYRVGLNWARSWHRRSTRRLPFHTTTSVEPPATADPELDTALMGLDVKYRAVVVCRYLLDWSTDQTADALDLRPGTVKSRLSTGLAQLRTALGGDHNDPDPTASEGPTR